MKQRSEALSKFMYVIAQISYGSIVVMPLMKGEVQIGKLIAGIVATVLAAFAGYLLTPKHK
ncbi:hypothetical protein FACS189452_07270 [Bacteroidia bacterium]|nr:hypothetical protein FACS189452_07270 [Bacteroidia bacterium]